MMLLSIVPNGQRYDSFAPRIREKLERSINLTIYERWNM
jgi:hypothetical protein